MLNKYHSGTWLIALAAIMWSFDAPFRLFLTEELSATSIVLLEHTIVSIVVVLTLFPYLKEVRQLDRRGWLALLFVAWGGSAVATILFTQSFAYVSPSVAILLQKLQPIFAILLAVTVLRERLAKRFWVWALVAILGAYFVSFPNGWPGGGLQTNMIGVALAVGAAFLWGGSTVFGRYLLRSISFKAMTAFRFLFAFLFLFGLQASRGALVEVSLAGSEVWLYAASTGLVAGFISLFIYYRGLRTTPASVATIAELVFPVAAVAVNWFWLEESLQLMQILGGVVVLGAITRLSWLNAQMVESTQTVLVS